MLFVGGGPLPATASDWWLVGLLALIPGNGHLLLNWAHPRVSAALSSLMLAAIPLLSSIWARLVYGEPYGPRHVVGMLLVVVAIELGRRAERDRRVALR
jgi:drug/metabolite transporter (DMT)-like permease